VRAAVLVLGDGGPDAGIARWRPLCHVGCPLAADGAFGALADALAEAERLEALATDRVAGWDDGLAAQPLPAADPELLQDPAHDRRAAALTMAAHDAYHLGQVALIRRLRGVPPLE
jgi:hypothetical protein